LSTGLNALKFEHNHEQLLIELVYPFVTIYSLSCVA